MLCQRHAETCVLFFKVHSALWLPNSNRPVFESLEPAAYQEAAGRNRPANIYKNHNIHYIFYGYEHLL